MRLIRGMRRALTEEEQHKIAGKMVGPPAEGHGRYLMPKLQGIGLIAWWTPATHGHGDVARRIHLNIESGDEEAHPRSNTRFRARWDRALAVATCIEQRC
jgi:hypothetical protein